MKISPITPRDEAGSPGYVGLSLRKKRSDPASIRYPVTVRTLKPDLLICMTVQCEL